MCKVEDENSVPKGTPGADGHEEAAGEHKETPSTDDGCS